MKLIKFFLIILFDIIDTYYHQNKILKTLKKFNLDINYFIDVGACNGKYTDLIINNLQVKNVLMFEPNKFFYYILKKKYKSNNYIKIFNNAVSNNNKLKKFYINKHNLTSSLEKLNEENTYLKIKAMLFDPGLNSTLIEKVFFLKTVRLIDVIKRKKIKKIDLIKIDTEGHEKKVLLGINNFIKKINYIIIEFHNDKIYFEYNSKEIHNYLIKKWFLLKKRFKFPFTKWEDRIYKNKFLV